MTEYIVRTEKPIRLDEVLHLHGIHHFSVQRLGKHGRLKDADALIEKTRMWSLVRGDEYFELRVNNTIVKGLLEAVPTIVEASE